jgi:hypothetical protein
MRRPSRKQLDTIRTFTFPQIVDLSAPSVTLHKRGRYVLVKANDIKAADALRELKLRMPVAPMRYTDYYSKEAQSDVIDLGKVEIWQHLDGDLTKHPYAEALKTFGVEVGTSITLQNYILKESRRQKIEEAAFPAPPVDIQVSLFERCSVGTLLLCTKDFKSAPSDAEPTFVKGCRYMVVDTGGQGVDRVSICHTAWKKGEKNIDFIGKGLRYDWSPFHAPMEDYFNDAENLDFGPDIRELYPKEIEHNRKRIAKLGFALFDHVSDDAALEALKRGAINGKLMRMGKTSEAITVIELWGSKKVMVVGTRNVRLAWKREFKRLNMTNYVWVDSFADLEKPAKYYLLTYDWIKQTEDKTKKQRKAYQNYLKAPIRKVQNTKAKKNESKTIELFYFNQCPHCEKNMERPVMVTHNGRNVAFSGSWTQRSGYLCRNENCQPETNNRKKNGAAWSDKGNAPFIKHKAGSYVDVTLALHSYCDYDLIKGRQCPTCKATDGIWIPPRYKRISRRFTAIAADEIHNAKDKGTLIARALYNMRARRKLGMTGTLQSNGPMDSYWPLHWVLRAPRAEFPYFGTEGLGKFRDRFCDKVYLEKKTGEVDQDGNEITDTVRKELPFLVNPPDFWKFMGSKVLRRNYSDPLYVESLRKAGMKRPGIDIKKVVCPMTTAQIRMTLAALQNFKDQYAKMQEEAESKHHEVNKGLVIAKMAALKTIATCPERLNKLFKTQVYDGVHGGGKLMHAKNIVAQKIAKGEKVLILSDFIESRTTIAEALKEFNPINMQSSWDDERREEAIEQFREDPKPIPFIAGTRSLKESVDLSSADTAICYDLLWSPAFQTQAWSRIMAATALDRTCEVYLMLSMNSLDEHIYNVFYAKLIAAEQAFDRKVVNRRAQDVDIKFFVERVLEEQEALTMQLRDMGEDEGFLPEMDISLMEERV